MSEFPLRDLAQSVLSETDADAWEIQEDDVWCRVTPPDPVERLQGWKLHVSATRLSAPEVLHRAAGVLITGGCGFKFARTLTLVEEMTSARYDRAQCGKFLTAYPRDDGHLRTLAEALDTATTGLPGPAILSDRPYRPGSLVHYRYGAFRGVPVLTDDGAFEVRLQAPDGTAVPDARLPWFSPPTWAQPPFPQEAKRPGGAGSPSSVLLADRFAVRGAIRHSARGGVYRALDQRTGKEVIIKQARAHVTVGMPGEDAHSALLREEAALVKLSGICPEPVARFEQSDHVFLVQELIPGLPLNRWVQERYDDPEGTGGLNASRVVSLAGKLTALLAEVHERGFVCQDFSPGNIMITPDEELRLIDPEFAREPGVPTRRAHTPGYAAPEQTEHRFGPALDGSVDRFSLGAVIFHLATGSAPLLAPDLPERRTVLERLEPLWPQLRADCPAVSAVEPAVRGLLCENPEERWTFARLREYLATVSSAAAPVPAVGPHRPAQLEAPLRQRLVDDGLSFLRETMADPARDPERLWPSGDFGDRTDPCSVQHGAAGVLSTLARAAGLLQRDELTELTASVASWIDARRTRIPRLLPGLYFGRSGTAWALHDAARALDDDELAEHALDLARSVPLRWPNQDICHGTAGAGMTQLHFWQATGRPEFLDRVTECADALVQAAEHHADRVIWPVPQDMDSELAGLRHLGFAHGVAGVGTFLLGAARCTGQRTYRQLACAAGDTLAAEAEQGPWGARWRDDIGDKRGSGMGYHWCSGSSGVGTFLLRLWQNTGDEGYLRLAEEAGAAVRWSQRQASSSACHGLAGNGQYLLDLADAVPSGPYRDWAGELALTLSSRHADRDGLLLLPDETGVGFRADHQTGMSGSLDFLLRFAHGGPRPWMADAPTGTGPTGTARLQEEGA
ncbi:class IV lanthionine synthetase LanL [Streptomyces sp. ACA25]|uniref:class IV lanthionine synthetase LanL n=1 Tax=Streptomyces sp. ACA25 TaxID=3022596 RepID=UPI00230783E4|nr:class IV lanthionine synthetase LanL [Streptomyces sp. ACA25]MDB1090021.1 class IV lanthionine synthetase LanL [Streptomyces sp. ACA25]